MFETWYILEDGSLGDPNEIGVGEDGILRHNDGRAVAYGPHGPLSSGVDAKALRISIEGGEITPNDARLVAGLTPVSSAAEKSMEPERPKRAYKTRQIKAD